MTKKRILNEYQLERLKEHKYASEGCSVLDPYMQPYWKWLVEQLPLTWAPNAITLFGLVGNVLSTIFLMIYCPNGHGEAPRWCFLLCAVCLFLYQSLDAIDGKQARRTNSSSPLGELFDHGCDAMSIVIIIVGTGIGTQMGTNPLMFSVVTFVTMVIFYTAQWRTYATRVMNFGFLDVTEGQIAVTSLYLFDSVFGTSIWHRQVFMGIRLGEVVWIFVAMFGLYVLAKFLLIINRAGDETSVRASGDTSSSSGRSEDENKKIYSFIPSRYIPAIPICIFLFFGFACCRFSESRLMENNVVLYNMMFGVVSTKLSCRVLVSYMTRSDMPYLDDVFLGPLLLLVSQLLSFPNELVVLWIVFIINTVNLLVYVRRVCCDICDHLNIYCFKITPPPMPASDRSAHCVGNSK